ncbi:hypothetical protein GCM10023080_036330 [Streptomyces pseudoechinosporeus]
MMMQAYMRQVADNVHLVHGSNTNWVILTEGDAVTLVDTGYPGDRAKVLESLAAVGSSPEAVRSPRWTPSRRFRGTSCCPGTGRFTRVPYARRLSAPGNWPPEEQYRYQQLPLPAHELLIRVDYCVPAAGI